MKQTHHVNAAAANSTASSKIRDQRWLFVTRWLHALIALGISLQLLLSLIMANPHRLQNASGLQKSLLESHEIVGLTTLFFMFLHWLWVLSKRSDVNIKNLFPWVGIPFQHLKEDVSYLIKEKRFPPVGKHGGLPGFIHGLGFLVATAMVVSGFALFSATEWGAGVNSDLFHKAGNIHGFFASLMWVYLAGHITAAAWHEYKGQFIITSMFRLFRN